MTDTRLVAPQEEPEDAQVAQTLRPRSLDECIGQDKVREHLLIAITAAKQRQEPLDHTLFHGPPGLGKTTFANVLATEMGVNIKVTAGPAIERPGDLAAILSTSAPTTFSLSTKCIASITPWRKSSTRRWRTLHWISSWVKAWRRAASVSLCLPFTLIGATTRLALISSPLRDRFGAHFHMEYYDLDAMSMIVERSAGILRVVIDEVE